MSFKEKLKNLKDRAVEFYKEHKTGVIAAGIGIGTFALGSYATYRMMQNNGDDESVPELDYDAEANAIENEVEEDDCCWKEEYNDDWNLVKNTADGLKHIDGFTWMICGPNTDYNPYHDTTDIYLVDDNFNYLTKPEDPVEES